MEHFRMEMESLSENEEFARVVMAVFMSRMNPTLEQVDDVKTAVSEAVTNAVIHGYRNREGIIVLAGEIQGTWLTVTVEDQGTGIRDVKRAMEPMYTTDRTGERSGMGFSFMEAFMDQVQVESEPGKGPWYGCARRSAREAEGEKRRPVRRRRYMARGRPEGRSMGAARRRPGCRRRYMARGRPEGRSMGAARRRPGYGRLHVRQRFRGFRKQRAVREAEGSGSRQVPGQRGQGL